MTRLRAVWRAIVCGVAGHAVRLEFAYGRLGWRCTHCGHEGEGWQWAVAPAVSARVVRFRQRVRRRAELES